MKDARKNPSEVRAPFAWDLLICRLIGHGRFREEQWGRRYVYRCPRCNMIGGFAGASL